MPYNRRPAAARDLLFHTGLSIGEITDRRGFGTCFIFRGNSVRPTI